MHFNTKLAAYI